jgi:hypothetical protein
MKRSFRTLVYAGSSFALALSLLATSPWGERVSAQSQEEEKCCYTNPRYHGVCVVTPGEGETCASVLAYLNNPNSVGKNYCGNTKVRMGWKQVTCEEESQALCR